MELSQPLIQRFWAKVDKRGPNDCWLWTGARQVTGYGAFNVNGRMRRASRVSWVIAHGPIPPGDHYGTMLVCHRCDNPPCVNPAHLFLGTVQDNMLDCRSKGRLRVVLKITDEQAREIRALWLAGGITQRRIAAMYGVRSPVICKIVNRLQPGRAWRESHQTE
jgi:hypothetical protein